ncbi:MAG: hypothetical protein WC485_05375 [Opitutaceae bacterium]
MQRPLLIALLVLSLAANAVLVARLRLQPAADHRVPSEPVPAVSRAKTNSGPSVAALLAGLEAGDATQLKAAGLSDETIRALKVGRAYSKLQTQIRATRPAPGNDGKYWRRPGRMSKEQQTADAQARREFTEAFREAFGDDATLFMYGADTRYSFLSAAKREQLHRIEQDYAELQQQIYLDSDGIQLSVDREKLKLLQSEKERDMAALLTPEDREQIELRSSNIAINIRSQYGDAIQTEEQYKQIFALHKAFNDQYGSDQSLLESGVLPSPEMLQARGEAMRQLQDDVLAVIGPEQYAAAQRANDPDNRALASLTRRLNLPENAPATVLAARDGYAAESMRINADTTLSAQDRRTQLQGLAAKAQADLQAVLGADGATAYAQRAMWLKLLQNGQAFSTNPKDAPAGRYNSIGASAVYPVAPAKTAPAPKG